MENRDRTQLRRLEYEAQAEKGELFIARRDGGLTIIAPPVGYRFEGEVIGWTVGSLVLLAAAVLGWRGAGARAETLFLAASATVFVVIALFHVGYWYHLSRRRIRVDVGDGQMRRTMIGPFGKRVRAWDVAELVAVNQVDRKEGHGSESDTGWYGLTVQTADNRWHALLDTVDEEQIELARMALKEALDL